MTTIYGLGGVPGAAAPAIPGYAPASTTGGINAATLAGGMQPSAQSGAPSAAQPAAAGSQLGMMMLNQILSGGRQSGGSQNLPYLIATGAA